MNQGGEGRGKDTAIPKAAPGATERAARRLDAKSRETIGRRLKALYDGVASEPVPDRFMDLLQQLERNEKQLRRASGTNPADE